MRRQCQRKVPFVGLRSGMVGGKVTIISEENCEEVFRAWCFRLKRKRFSQNMASIIFLDHPIHYLMKKHLVTNTNGFSLIQVLVAIGLLGILTAGLMSVMANSYKHETNLGTLLEARELSGELGELVKSPNCGIVDLETPMALPAGVLPDGKTIALAKGVSGRFLEFKSGDSYGRFRVSNLSIAPYYDRKDRSEKYIALDGASSTDFDHSKLVKASLRLDVFAKDTPKAPIRTPIVLSIDNATKTIIGCSVSMENTDLASVCASFGGVWDDAESRCQLPCPAGLAEENGVCVAKAPDAENEEMFCNVNEKCPVASKYILTL